MINSENAQQLNKSLNFVEVTEKKKKKIN